MTENESHPAGPPNPALPTRRTRVLMVLGIVLGSALVTIAITALLTNIFERKQEAKNPYIRFVEVTEETTDPAPWGVNWPREFDSYEKTAQPTRTRFGGHGGSESLPEAKIDRDPWLKRIFAGYAFSLDYRDRRGHFYMLADQEMTRRVTERPQPGACLHCHASVMPTYRRLGGGDVFKGFEATTTMTYQAAHDELVKTGSMNPRVVGTEQKMVHVAGAHPVSCVDCHDPKSMQLRVTRPGFIRGIQALKGSQGIKDYDPNRDATRQEMRSFVCGQCHVEYYCGPKTTLFFPWGNGLKGEQIEAYYDNYKFPPTKQHPEGQRFFDWTHAESGAEVLKAQHPEFELFSQGIHARSGVACADCHMPYERQGAQKVSDHWVRSPLLNIARACQTCHPFPEDELKARVDVIQARNLDLLQRSGKAATDFLDTMKGLRKPFDDQHRADAQLTARTNLAKDESFGKADLAEQEKRLAAATQAELNTRWAAEMAKRPDYQPIAELHRKAQWRLDFIAAENSMGFHAPQEASRILGESIDYFRQAQILTQRMLPPAPATRPVASAK